MTRETGERAVDFKEVSWISLKRAFGQLDPFEASNEEVDPEVYSSLSEKFTDEGFIGWILLNPFHIAEMDGKELVDIGFNEYEIGLLTLVLQRAKQIQDQFSED